MNNSKGKKLIKITAISISAILACFVILVIAFAIIVWYETFDIIGLTLYKDEPIVDMIPSDGRYYLITEDGDGYVVGGYGTTHHRKYRNAEFYSNEKLGIPYSPVRFYDGKIKKTIVYDASEAESYGVVDDEGLLFINDDDILYDVDDFEATEICANAKGGYKDDRANTYFVIDTSDRLFMIDASGERKDLFNDVRDVKTYHKSLFVLFNDGKLCEFSDYLNGISYENKIVIYENVEKFNILNVATRHTEERGIHVDDKALNDPLINVLTFEHTLYVKGPYNLLMAPISIALHPEPAYHNDWTLIGENVKDFSMSVSGTAMLLENYQCAYYGFNTDTKYRSELKFGSITLPVDNAVSIYATEICVCVKTQSNYYIWSGNDDMLFDSEEEHNLFDDAPLVLIP